MSEKKVRITIEMTSSFVKLLNVGVRYSLENRPKKISPMQVLALASLLEARGATVQFIQDMIPTEWAKDIKVISEDRKVYEDGKLVGSGA